MPKAARDGDPIAHTSAMGGLLAGVFAGAAIGLTVGALIVGGVVTVATGGLAAPVLIVGAGLGGWIGEFVGSMSFCSPVTGALLTGSMNVFINGKKAARAMLDIGACSKDAPVPALIAQGSGNVYINQYPAARLDDHLVCGAFIKDGSPNVFIGGGQQKCLDFEEDVPAWAPTGP
jgi:uncharacterized Zn-binding protein involved in type VI secretion